MQFKGCLILVSHDRFFMDKLTEHLFVFKGDGIIEDHYCSYSDYRAKQIKEEKEFKKIQHLEKENSKVKSNVKKLSFNEKYEFDRIESELVDLENEKKKLEENLQKASVAINEVVQITKRLATVVEIIDSKELRWLELSEKQ